MAKLHDDSVAFSELSDAVLAEAQGVWPETGSYYKWRRGTIRLMIYVHYFTGGESGRHKIPHSVLAPKMHPHASPDSALKGLRRDLKSAEKDFAACGFWPILFKRGTRELYDKSGNLTNDPAKADPRQTKYVESTYWWSEPGAEYLHLIRESAGGIDLMARDRLGRIAGLAEIIKTVGAHFGKPAIIDKPQESKSKSEEKAKPENGGITVARFMHELQQMPRRDQVPEFNNIIEAGISHLIADSQDYPEAVHIFSKAQTAMFIGGKHSLDDLRQRIARLNNSGRPAPPPGTRAAALRSHLNNIAATLASFEQWTAQADADDLPEVAALWRHFTASLNDFKWAISEERKGRAANEPA